MITCIINEAELSFFCTCQREKRNPLGGSSKTINNNTVQYASD